jgi:hypothetical protein
MTDFIFKDCLDDEGLRGKRLSPDSPEDMMHWKEIIRYNRSGKTDGTGVYAIKHLGGMITFGFIN